MPPRSEKQRFAAALITLCEGRKSVSVVARGIGVNRQQFQKYLTGETFPSPNMRRRIAHYFGVTPKTLFDPDAAATLVDLSHDSASGDGFSTPVSQQEMARLREYAGIYHVHFVSPAFPDLIHIGVSLLREQNGAMETNFFVRSRNPKTGLVHRSQLKGSVNLRGERLFVVERSKKAHDRLSETILLPTHGDRMRYLTGLSLGLTWHPDSRPYASRTIWRRALVSHELRAAIRLCGLFPAQHPAIDSQVRGFLLSDRDSLNANVLAL